MRTLKNRMLVLICLLMVTSNYAIVFAFTDDYPKNPKIDAIMMELVEMQLLQLRIGKFKCLKIVYFK